MDYCRFGRDSDVYLYESTSGGWECCRCPLKSVPGAAESEAFNSIEDVIAHMHAHSKVGHRVPDKVFEDLEMERERLDGGRIQEPIQTTADESLRKMPKDIEAEIHFLATDEGGRQGPASSGYRGQFHYYGRDWDAVQQYPDVTEANPGDTVRAYLTFLSPHKHVDNLHVGKEFLVREGQRTLALGKVTRVLDLEASASRLDPKAH